jgi:putative aldouronate transport system permease protein
MTKQTNISKASGLEKRKKTSLLKDLNRDKLLYLMFLPGFLFFVVFKYLPMWGVSIAFKDYLPFLGIMKSPWVGFKHFERLFSEPIFWQLFRNTIVLAIYNIVFYFPLPIILALLLNEVKRDKFKKTVQSLIYMPHFISWVVVAGISFTMLTNEGGIINELIKGFGGNTVNFLGSEGWFRPLITMQVMWKESGWGTIIFLAALAGVDVQLYEAATVDGANRWQQLVHVTMPAIKSTIIVLFILRMGTFLDSGFEQVFLMLNSLNRGVGEVFDTYVYTAGMTNGQLSYSTAVGLFKSTVSLILVLSVNKLAEKLGEEGVY